MSDSSFHSRSSPLPHSVLFSSSERFVFLLKIHSNRLFLNLQNNFSELDRNKLGFCQARRNTPGETSSLHGTSSCIEHFFVAQELYLPIFLFVSFFVVLSMPRTNSKNKENLKYLFLHPITKQTHSDLNKNRNFIRSKKPYKPRNTRVTKNQELTCKDLYTPK